MTEKKAIHKAFGKGGPSCPCCNPGRGKRGVRKGRKRVIKRMVRSARRDDRRKAIREECA